MEPINLERVLMRHVFPNMQHLFGLTKAGLSFLPHLETAGWFTREL